ncbi:UPF0389 protein CG9231-like [Contarinia nasturtii]|uniref:UPF0389 protein CG9231-like n=1 Tax=Contarinia nasturtii TaxID=265458 RepID=UPI0012D3DA84|nr:UPF0389 protein CG9231-like [Contarinia nasturtii]
MIHFITKAAMVRMPTHSSLKNVRFLTETSKTFGKVLATPTPTTQSSSASATQPQTNPDLQKAWESHDITVSNWDKRVLVSVGKYKRIADVPKKVSYETIEHSRDRFRIKMVIYMMVVSAIISYVQIVRGKNAHKRGESVVNNNMEWHRKYNEEAAKK